MRRAVLVVGLLGGCAEPAGDATSGPGSTATPSTTTAVDGSSSDEEGETTDPGTGTLGSGESSTGASYPAGPYGIEVGDVIAPLSFLDEHGDDVFTEEVFGAPQRAFVLFGTAAW